MIPTLGRIVHYKLTQQDADTIQLSRHHTNRITSGTTNVAKEGQSFPAMVVAKWGDTSVNLHVFLDGDDTYWATSRMEGTQNGQWSWPPQPAKPTAKDDKPAAT